MYYTTELRWATHLTVRPISQIIQDQAPTVPLLVLTHPDQFHEDFIFMKLHLKLPQWPNSYQMQQDFFLGKNPWYEPKSPESLEACFHHKIKNNCKFISVGTKFLPQNNCKLISNNSEMQKVWNSSYKLTARQWKKKS